MTACIFDLDGTLTNTLESMTYSVNLTLKEMGLSQITKDQCRMFVGNGARVLIEESLKVSGDPKASRIEEGMKIYGRIFDQNCTYHVTLYEGIPGQENVRNCGSRSSDRKTGRTVAVCVILR